MLSKHVECSIINAGDGRHEHPTQALLDAAVIKEEGINLEGLKIAICGDILNSRVARSNIYLLTTMGAQVSVIGPPTLIPKDIERMVKEAEKFKDEDGLIERVIEKVNTKEHSLQILEGD